MNPSYFTLLCTTVQKFGVRILIKGFIKFIKSDSKDFYIVNVLFQIIDVR